MSPIEKIKDGIITLDMQKVADGYFQLTGEEIVVPSIDINKNVVMENVFKIIEAGASIIYGDNKSDKESDEENEEEYIKSFEEDRQEEKPNKKRGRPKGKKNKVKKEEEKQDVAETEEEFDIGYTESEHEIQDVFSGEKRKIKFIGTEESDELKKESELIKKNSRKQKRKPHKESPCSRCGNMPAYMSMENDGGKVKTVFLCNNCVSKNCK